MIAATGSYTNNRLCGWLLLLVMIVAMTATTNADTYPIDWTEVQQVATSTVSRAASIPANTNLGTCICDLTWFQCDVNCVCDSDCSSSEKASFTTSLPTGEYIDNNTVCVDPDFLKVNSRGGISTFFLDSALCVNKESSSLSGSYFALPPTTISDATFTAYRNGLTTTYEVTTTAATSHSWYFVGDPIGALRLDSSGSPYSYNRNALSVPVAGPGGLCNDNSYAQYLLDSNHSCTRAVTSLQTECLLGSSSSLAANAFLYNLYATASPVSSTGLASASQIAIEFADIEIVDSLGNYTQVNVTRSTGTFPSLSWDATTCTCSNVLLQLEYHLTYLISGFLTRAQVKVVLGSVTSSSSSCATSSPARLTQSYAVSFNRTDLVDVPHPKSGNPGYLVGYPLLVGTHVSIGSATYENAIAQEIDGLQLLPQTSTSECIPLSTLPGYLDSPGETVTFAENMFTSCSLTMNLAQLQAACTSGILGTYLNITSIKDYWFGVFGDSDYRKFSTDWKEFSTITPTRTLISGTTSAWNSNSRTCLSIFNSVNLEMLYVPVGSKLNPQYLILAGRIVFGESTWSYRYDDTSTAQAFPVFATVTWMPYYNTTYTPSTKPNLPAWPRDYFYIFYNDINGASSMWRSNSIISLLTTAFVSLFLIFYSI